MALQGFVFQSDLFPVVRDSIVILQIGICHMLCNITARVHQYIFSRSLRCVTSTFFLSFEKYILWKKHKCCDREIEMVNG